MSNIFESILWNLRENKAYWICEAIIFIGTLSFILKLNSYNKILLDIQSRYSNEIIKALEVAKEPSYFNYFFGGAFVIIVLIGYTMFVLKKLRGESILIVIINIILIIVFFKVYWNPVLATFAVLLTIGGIFAVANS